MNWYSLYVNGRETSSALTFYAAESAAGALIDAQPGARVSITYGTPNQIIRAWQYNRATKAWDNQVAPFG